MDRLLNQCYRILLSREQAEDVVQDLFIRLPVTLADFETASSLNDDDASPIDDEVAPVYDDDDTELLAWQADLGELDI